ncbi:radical SAM protein [Thermodesulfobacteriota bacterium]
MTDLNKRLKYARELSWQNFGKVFTAYLPGMFSYDGTKGDYPAVSITGKKCALQCDHCKGRLLRTMPSAVTPEKLVEMALYYEKKGCHGILITGGCDRKGRLPWNKFLPSVKKIKDTTGLFVSAHSGILDASTAKGLKDTGIDQALIDVIGDDSTYKRICHVDHGVSKIYDTIEYLTNEGIDVIPHIICGLEHGTIKHEKRALKALSVFNPGLLVIVSLMPLPKTPLWGKIPPAAEEIAEIIIEARHMMPHTVLSLGCARQRGDINVELMAVDAGVNRIAIPSEETIEHAREYGLEIKYQKTCCSVSQSFPVDRWEE